MQVNCFKLAALIHEQRVAKRSRLCYVPKQPESVMMAILIKARLLDQLGASGSSP